MRFDKNTIDLLCGKIALSETEDKKSELSDRLSYYTNTLGRISDTEKPALCANKNTVDYSMLRDDVPKAFDDADRLFGSTDKSAAGRLCVPKIMSGN